MKRNNVDIVGIPGEKKGTQSIFKAAMAEKSPNLGREMHIQILETQRSSNSLNWIELH